jgi:hypothetical protein
MNVFPFWQFSTHHPKQFAEQVVGVQCNCPSSGLGAHMHGTTSSDRRFSEWQLDIVDKGVF